MSSRAVARSLAGTERRLKDMERAQRLKNSAIPQVMGVYDKKGILRILLGEQVDGSFTVTSTGGLKPPKPSQPLTVAQPLGALVIWTGLSAAAAGEEDLPDPGDDGAGSWEDVDAPAPADPLYAVPAYASPDGVPPVIDPDEYLDEEGNPITDLLDAAWEDPDDVDPPDPDAEFADIYGRWPNDFERVEIHMKKQPATGPFDTEFTCTDATQVGVFTTAGRAVRKTVNGLEAGSTYWMRLQAVTQGGREGRPSTPVSVVPLGLVTEEDVETALDAAMDALAAADAAAAFAATKNRVFWEDAPPVSDGSYTLVANDTWYDTNDGNKIHKWSGSAWVEATGSYVLTPNGKLSISPGGIIALDAAGTTATFILDAATGAITMKGDLTTGSNITGAIITSGPTGQVQTSSTPSVGIKMNSTAFIAYGGGTPTFSITTATGAVAMLGGLLTGGSVTAALVETTATALRGLKLSPTGLIAYDTSGSSTFQLTSSGFASFSQDLFCTGEGHFNDGITTGASSHFSGGIQVLSGFNSISGGGEWLGGLAVGGGINVSGGLTSAGGADMGGTVTMGSLGGTGGSSFVMVGNAGILSRGQNFSQGAADSGGTGFRVLRVPN